MRGIPLSGTLRVGIVGAGGVSHAHLTAWRHIGAQVRVFSIDGQASRRAEQFGIVEAFSLDELIAGSDVVDVCVPTHVHEEIVFAAAAARRQVVCEKPLSLTHSGAQAMIDACRAAGVQMYPGQVVRYFPQYAAARAAVDAGQIGAPAVLRLARRSAAPVSGWFADPALSGGLLVDQMIHDYDYARWLCGDVAAVYAKTIHNGRQVTAYAVLTHESGALSHVTGSWGPPRTLFGTSFTISGSHGQLRHSSLERTALRWDAPAVGDGGGTLLPLDSTAPFIAELGEFATAFQGGPTPRVSAEDSLAALDIALAAVASAASGQPINPKDVAR